ncbi:MAG: hypothetical protein JO224_09475 [Pelomonas sp.]|nr:hypothetical protein [Roseateles sp.]
MNAKKADAPPAPAKRRGRPPAGERAMSNAERQRRYRRRRFNALYEIDPAEMARVTLLERLAAALRTIEDPGSELREGAAHEAENLLAEIVTRYELNLARMKRITKPNK